MTKKILYLLLFLISLNSFSQTVLNNVNLKTSFPYKTGEWLKFRMSYSNFLNAGYSTMEIKDSRINKKEVYHVVGKGKSTGIVSLFFKVRDNYETYIDKKYLRPVKFIRKINEGGYTKDKEILFDYYSEEAIVKDFKHKTLKKHPINNEIQDILSSLYYIRNKNLNQITVGDEIILKMFFDEEITNFKLHFIGREIIKTKFGKIKTLKFKPLVQTGRVFKEQESVTIWITDDKNKIPIRIKASLVVGSLRADLEGFKGLAHPFNIIFNN